MCLIKRGSGTLHPMGFVRSRFSRYWVFEIIKISDNCRRTHTLQPNSGTGLDERSWCRRSTNHSCCSDGRQKVNLWSWHLRRFASWWTGFKPLAPHRPYLWKIARNLIFPWLYWNISYQFKWFTEITNTSSAKVCTTCHLLLCVGRLHTVFVPILKKVFLSPCLDFFDLLSKLRLLCHQAAWSLLMTLRKYLYLQAYTNIHTTSSSSEGLEVQVFGRVVAISTLWPGALVKSESEPGQDKNPGWLVSRILDMKCLFTPSRPNRHDMIILTICPCHVCNSTCCNLLRDHLIDSQHAKIDWWLLLLLVRVI